MKLNLPFFLLIFICSIGTSYAQSSNTDDAYLEYVKTIDKNTENFSTLLPAITKPGHTLREKLTLVYFWVFEHIDFDTDRFTKTGPLQPLSIVETLKSGKALCYEYNQLVSVACNYLKISGYDIEGYVKYYGFEPGQPFKQNNHIWHVIYIDNNWEMIDLLWASGNLSIKNGNYKFNKKLNKAFFLAKPIDFLSTHLPADPIWQFETRPLKIAGFAAKAFDIDDSQRGEFINYTDSISAMNKLNTNDRELRSVTRAYQFNTNNPNQLIVTYYNIAVAIVNKSNAPKSDLLKAKNYFLQSKQLITKTDDPDIKSLQQVCEQALVSIETRLKRFKS